MLALINVPLHSNTRNPVGGYHQLPVRHFSFLRSEWIWLLPPRSSCLPSDIPRPDSPHIASATQHVPGRALHAILARLSAVPARPYHALPIAALPGLCLQRAVSDQVATFHGLGNGVIPAYMGQNVKMGGRADDEPGATTVWASQVQGASEKQCSPEEGALSQECL